MMGTSAEANECLCERPGGSAMQLDKQFVLDELKKEGWMLRMVCSGRG